MSSTPSGRLAERSRGTFDQIRSIHLEFSPFTFLSLLQRAMPMSLLDRTEPHVSLHLSRLDLRQANVDLQEASFSLDFANFANFTFSVFCDIRSRSLNPHYSEPCCACDLLLRFIGSPSPQHRTPSKSWEAAFDFETVKELQCALSDSYRRKYRLCSPSNQIRSTLATSSHRLQTQTPNRSQQQSASFLALHLPEKTRMVSPVPVPKHP